MGAGWVSGSVRAQGLLRDRVGPESALLIARSGSLEGGASLVAGAEARGEQSGNPSLETAQRAVAATLLLRIRLLAAWLPRDGVAWLRALASWFELSNIEDRLAYLAGGELRHPYELGTLASAWHEASTTQSTANLAGVLAGSSWGDPGSADPARIHLALRLAWARRVSTQVPTVRPWAAGAVALLLAQELFVAGQPADADLVQRAGLGSAWQEATNLTELVGRLPPRAAWALAGTDSVDTLWRAELAWWHRVAADAERMIHGRLESGEVVLGALGLLAYDTFRLRAALAAAERGSRGPALEVVDALC